MTLVKICGIRSVESAQIAVSAGADFIGLNFVPNSKRIISIEKAKEIALSVMGKIAVVGIFRNQPVDEVNTIVEKVGLDYVQLHGDEDQNYINSMNARVIKAFSIPSDFDVEQTYQLLKSFDVYYFLLDRQTQGEGEMLSTEKLKELASNIPFFLAGGLTLDNVSEIISHTKPFGVDVAGGIETEGKEDGQKIIRFIQQAKQ